MSIERIGLFHCYLFFANILQGFNVLERVLVDEVMGGAIWRLSGGFERSKSLSLIDFR